MQLELILPLVEWYLGILNEIVNALDLKIDIFEWWIKRAVMSPSQKLVDFFREVLLKEIEEHVVLFFDEIDSTLSIPFSDDFFAALRAIYNARSTLSDFRRLSFVLIGVASPSELISDKKLTPFNIGHRVELNDFTFNEAKPLANGLGQNAEQVLSWVLGWTGGHPYLTQRLCAYLANNKSNYKKETIARIVDELFIDEVIQKDSNIQFIGDMLAKRSPNLRRTLLVYKGIRTGKNVVDDEHSITKTNLKFNWIG